VNALQALVNQEKAWLNTPDFGNLPGCPKEVPGDDSLSQVLTPLPQPCVNKENEVEATMQTKLKANKFKLQVAQDQLMKDESGN
jgi:hypothetical protein